VFVVKSYRCAEKEARSITIEKIKPEFSELKWYSVINENDSQSKEEEITNIDFGSFVKIKTKVKNLNDGDKVLLLLYDKKYSEEDAFVFKTILEVKNGIIEWDWKAICSKERLAELTSTDKLEFIFRLKAFGTLSKDSPALEIQFYLDIDILMNPEFIDADNEFILQSDDESYRQTKNVKDDKITGDDKITLHFDKIKPGQSYSLKYADKSQNDGFVIFHSIDFRDLIEL